MSKIAISSVTKRYGKRVILNDLSLEIDDSIFFALLGPSGCGKTTLLRLLAGLERVDSGRIYIGGTDVTDVPVYKRRVHTVFQNYALFPHMDVYENVAYSLRLKGVPEDEIKRRVHAVLESVHMLRHIHKEVTDLSGGEQQRVALARAIVDEPEVLLLDEPLAALDVRLKEKLLVELINIQERVRTTFVYVTHDQMEALTVADKMAIMNANGGIEQVGTPEEVYEFPRSRFVANFVGTSNIFSGTLRQRGNGYVVETDNVGDIWVKVRPTNPWAVPGRTAYVCVRPEKIAIFKQKSGKMHNELKGRVRDIIYAGKFTQYFVDTGNTIVQVFRQNIDHMLAESIDPGEEVYVGFSDESTWLMER